MSRNIRYIDAEKIQFLPLSVKIGCNKYDVYGAEPERVIMEIHDMVAYKGDIDAIPTADVEEVKHGKWVFVDGYITCNRCGCQPYREHKHIDFNNLYKRCPECGTHMR